MHVGEGGVRIQRVDLYTVVSCLAPRLRVRYVHGDLLRSYTDVMRRITVA